MRIFFLIIYCLTTFMVMGQQAENELIPVDSEFRIGQLENGLSYYIRHHENPKNRASFYLVHNVGAVLEEEHENGLAHFLEHMAFKGSDNFPNNSLVPAFERYGVKFGRDLNAGTNVDQTIYKLKSLPVENEGVIDTALLALHDWCGFLQLKEEDIEVERGVIKEEWRTTRSSASNLRDKTLPLIFNGSKYSRRNVIGDMDIIASFEPEVLRHFYQKWSQPKLQAVVVVGDIDVDNIEEKIKKQFAALKTSVEAAPRMRYDIQAHDGLVYQYVSEPGVKNMTVTLFSVYKNRDGEERTFADYKDSFKKALYNSIIKERFGEISKQSDSKFISVSHSIGFIHYGHTQSSRYARAAKGNELVALSNMVKAIENIKQYGFTKGEIERAKRKLIISMKQQLGNPLRLNNDNYAAQAQKHFLRQVPLIPKEYNAQHFEAVIEAISNVDMMELAQNYNAYDNLVISITGPDDYNGPSEQTVLNTFNEARNAKQPAFKERELPDDLMTDLPKAGSIVKTKRLKAFEAEEWTLSNGVKVIYKQVDNNPYLLQVKAVSDAGKSQVSISDLPTTHVLGEMAGVSGVSEYSGADIGKITAGKSYKVKLSMSEFEEQLYGYCSVVDSETLLQHIHLQFSAPRFNENDYYSFMSKYAEVIKNGGIKQQINDSINCIMYNHHPRLNIKNTEAIEQMTFESYQRLMQERYGNAGKFTFFMVGNIDKETAEYLAETYLASLPAMVVKEKKIDHQIGFPSGLTEARVNIKQTNPKGTVVLFMNAPLNKKAENKVIFSVLKNILSIRMNNAIRLAEGGTYSVGVVAGTTFIPDATAKVGVRFDCDPDKTGKLMKVADEQLELLSSEPVSAKELEIALLQIKNKHNVSKDKNSYWLNTLVNYHSEEIDYSKPENSDYIYENLTPERIQKVFSKFVRKADKVAIMVVPE